MTTVINSNTNKSLKEKIKDFALVETLQNTFLLNPEIFDQKINSKNNIQIIKN